MIKPLFTLPDSDPDPGTNIRPKKMGTVMIGDLDWNASPSLCNGNHY